MLNINYEHFWYKEYKTNEECLDLLEKYEKDDYFKLKSLFSLYGFVNYLNDNEQSIENPISQQVYQDMSLPIFNYFISSSHNT